MAKTVKRTWFNKKTGQLVTKTYTYEHKSKRGLTLVDKRGRIMQKNINKFKDTINDNPNYTEGEKITLISDLNAVVNRKHLDKVKLTTNGFMGIQQEEAIPRFFVNAGYSPEEFANEIGEAIEDVLDENNWVDEQLIINGRVFKFNWTYTGNFFEEL